MSALMPTRLEALDHHSQRKHQLKNRVACLKMPDTAYKSINPALIFNLSLEPAYVFNLGIFADKLSDENIVSGRASLKLQDNTLYIESDTARYEICKKPAGQDVASLM